jgi:hypothetical protein
VPDHIDGSRNAPSALLTSGVVVGDGDGTVPLLSLGYLCARGWRDPARNPGRSPIITREFRNVADGVGSGAASAGPGGGGSVLTNAAAAAAAQSKPVDKLTSFAFELTHALTHDGLVQVSPCWGGGGGGGFAHIRTRRRLWFDCAPHVALRHAIELRGVPCVPHGSVEARAARAGARDPHGRVWVTRDPSEYVGAPHVPGDPVG